MADHNPLQTTPLHALHQDHKAKLVPFAGYEMPVHYAPGIIKEHLHTRTMAGLFDVSHMGQIRVVGEDIAAQLENQIPADLIGLAAGRQKYGLLLNLQGGVLDDLMAINRGDHFVLIVNAACKHDDLALLKDNLGNALQFEMMEDLALIALQGPEAADVLSKSVSQPEQDVSRMKFMDVQDLELAGFPCIVSRSGYSGEDGFEISLAAEHAPSLSKAFLSHDSVNLAGLGARDSLRMEAGLCLYGQDLDSETTPIEAGLKWAISPPRRAGGAREGGFPGADIILDQIVHGTKRKLVGLLPEGRAPMRTGTQLFDQDSNPVGSITSGGFSPSLGHPISMGYVNTALSAAGTFLQAEVRGKLLPVSVATLPFVSHRYAR